MKAALVLSGGGAKGAYQVGVVQALVAQGIQVNAIAGASIGALNGGVLAGAPSLPVGLSRLEEIWHNLAHESPLEHNLTSYLRLLTSAGLLMQGPWAQLASTLSTQQGLLSDAPLRRLMDQYLDLNALRSGLPLYVSVFETQNMLKEFGSIIRSELGLGENKDSEFLHIQALPPAVQKEALLASAALPLLFEARRIDGKNYSDGGQGGWRSAQGNTPIQPLIDQGYKLIIVTHLADGSMWDRTLYPDVTIVEIRPQQPMARNHGIFGGAKDLLGFNPDTIDSWIKQGNRDALDCLGKVLHASRLVTQLNASQMHLKHIEARGEAVSQARREAMKKLRDGA